jgi:hypothetical protein
MGSSPRRLSPSGNVNPTLSTSIMVRRIARAAVLSTCVILKLCVVAGGLSVVGTKPAAAAGCGLGLGFVPATLSASPATIEVGGLTTLILDLGSPSWFECDGGTNPVDKIYNQRVVGLSTLQIYSGDGQFTSLSSLSGFHFETSFTYLNEGRYKAGGEGSAPIISGDPDMTIIGSARILFDQQLTYLPNGQKVILKDRSVSILVFALPTTVTVVPEPEI